MRKEVKQSKALSIEQAPKFKPLIKHTVCILILIPLLICITDCRRNPNNQPAQFRFRLDDKYFVQGNKL